MFYYLDMKNKNYATVIQNRVTNCCIPKEGELKPTHAKKAKYKSNKKPSDSRGISD
jgi:hypothetical protein